MGVQGLWTLLSPAGRKLRVEALEGQRLAIDVSIWVIRMIYGFSGEHNSQFKNVHLIGIFKRLIRLLSAGIKPVFVFDGKAPELKRHTLYLRQLQREKRSVNLQKLAENYVIRQLEGKLRSGKTIENNEPEEDPDDLESLNSEEMNEFEKNLSEYQTKIVEAEFQQLVNQQRKYPGLLKDIIESVSEFYTFDIPSKIAVVKEANQRLLDIKNSDLSKITDLEQFSIQQAQNYVQYVINKREVLLVKEAGQNEMLGKQEEFLLKDASSAISDQLKHKLVTDNDTKLITGVVNADKDKMFLFISKNKQIEEEKNSLQEGKQDASGNNNSKNMLVTSKIGVLSRPIRKTRAEKNKEIQERLSHLLKQRETEFLQLKKSENAKITSQRQVGRMNQQMQGRTERKGDYYNEDELCFTEENEKEGVSESQKKQMKKNNNFGSDSELNFDEEEEEEDEKEHVEELGVQNCLVKEGRNEENSENYQEQSKNNRNILESLSEEEIENSNKSEGQSQMSTAGLSTDAASTSKKIQEIVNANKRDSYEILRSKVQQDVNSQSQQGINNQASQDKESSLIDKKQEGERGELDIEMDMDELMGEKKKQKKLSEGKEVRSSNSQKEQTQPLQQKPTRAQEIEKNDKDTGELMTQLEKFGKRGEQGRIVESDKIKKEKEDFQKLLQQLKIEEEKVNMTPEEIEIQAKNQKNERQNTLKKQNQNNNIANNSMKEKEKEEEEEEEEEEEDDVEDIKAMLARMDKWEEEQNKAGEEGVELNDEELAVEFQRFINLNEMDSESIQTKFQQVRQLLLLFGVPWIESPSEAEAQCAILEQLGLVDGVITDDSDVFLFGATKVYRGLFGKECDFVRYFDGKQIANDIGISREKLIHMALFLGSDYTLGIKGVGIVNSMEIVTAFESIDGLRRFKQWASKADVLLEDMSSHYRGISLKEKNYKDQHKNYKKHWEIPPDFPSERVINAYLTPNADNSTEPFHWGQANIQLLQTYCEQVFGWSQELAMYFLKPLQMRLTKQLDPQKKITDFYSQAQKFAVVNSNRLKSAIRDLKKEDGHETEEQLQEIKRVEKVLLGITKPHINAQDKKKKTTRKTAIDVQEEEEEEEQDGIDGTSNNEKNTSDFLEVDKQLQKIENNDLKGFKYKPGQKGQWGNKRRNFKKDIF